MKVKLKKIAYQGGLVLLGVVIGVSYLIAIQTYQGLSDFIK